ncbi:general substrate transporter [Lentinus tigrinus ALCF2SS1-7]|uniref:General substrate transporter n=1 Tax=Lentinus tigrinus ALCF2SS1-6 TaxID=1328759 RepID=A0A5C2RSX3_9APHY|nr:general substrate transporter [Lentinus tigrinus ALCF2SS1-6]RPD69607.1 general substrate transporter [Lentinus tigrinus ALCF2SS1-7]
MGGPAAVSGGNGAGYADLVDKSKPWWKNTRLIKLNLCILLLLITSTTNGYDGSMMNGLQSLPQWNQAFDFPSGGKLGLLSAIQNIGCLAAYPFSPYVMDGLGRRAAVVFGAFVMCIATVIQTASNSVGMFIGARFLIGWGLTFAAAAAPVLVTEIAYPTHRAPATSLYNTLWFLGSIIAAWTTFGTFHVPTSWSWRIPSAIQALPSVIQVLLVMFTLPESPRWLCSKGREEEALRTLAYYHAKGDRTDPLVEYEFEEIRAAIKFDREVAANVGWLSLIRSPGNRRRLRIMIAIAFFSQWSGNNLISYYMNKIFDAVGITDPTIQLLINGILNIYNFIIAIIAGLLCDKVGRRPLFIASTIGMFVFWVLQTACFALYSKTGNIAAAHTFIAMIFLFYAFYDIAFTPLIVSYTVEILPFALRAKGFTVFNFALTLSLIFNQYINPIALKALGWKYYLVYVCWLAFEIGFIWRYLIETKNRTLEETAALFDGEDTAERLAHHAAENLGIPPADGHSDGEKGSSEDIEEVKVAA